nr:HAD hydrolase-like protein [Brachybacterium timonense]
MRSIIWDFGGTLFDTYPDLDRALCRTVFADDAPEHLLEVGRLTRVSTGHAVRELSRRFGVAEQELRQAQADVKDAWMSEPAPLMEGACEVMHAVHTAGGLNLVATHRDRASAEQLLQARGVHVDDMVCAPDGFPRKPDPTMHRELLRRHGLEPEGVGAVGDRPADAQAATGAGVRPFLLLSPGIELRADGAEPIQSLCEILTWLGRPQQDSNLQPTD